MLEAGKGHAYVLLWKLIFFLLGVSGVWVSLRIEGISR